MATNVVMADAMGKTTQVGQMYSVIHASVCLTCPLIIILVLPPGVVGPSNRALPMIGTVDGDVVSRCQVLGRACSVHHGADQ